MFLRYVCCQIQSFKHIILLSFLLLFWLFTHVVHNLVSDEDVVGSLHRYRPQFLQVSDGIPSYYYPYEFQHTCLLEDAVGMDDEQLHQSSGLEKCVARPFVSHDHFQTKYVADKMVAVVKEVSVTCYSLCFYYSVLLELILLNMIFFHHFW